MHISKPCHEHYVGMSPSGDGRHCQVCSTTVVDFTSMSVADIGAYFKANTGQNICGRFRAEQVSSDRLSSRILWSLRRFAERHVPVKPFRWALLTAVSAMFSLSSCIMGKRADPEIMKGHHSEDSIHVQQARDSTGVKH